MNDVLETPLKYFRAPKARGGSSRVDHKGGRYEQGLISGVSVITRGEALGHGVWIDATMLEQTAEAINATSKGIKSRFTHPSISDDGLGRHVGRVFGASVQGDQVIADQHFSKSGHATPDGDLAGYLLNLAEEDPEAYGLSIVFKFDEDAMDQFTDRHVGQDGSFRSPDPLNTQNFPHVRLAEIRAVDAVDEPAANPDGLFSRKNDLASDAEAMACFALGLSDEAPTTAALGMDPNRVRSFVNRFLKSKNLTVEATDMLEDKNDEADRQDTEATDTTEEESRSTDEETVADAVSENKEETATEAATSSREESKRFMEAFGKDGAVWYAEGLNFDQARKRYDQQRDETIESLQKQLAARGVDGERDPVEFDSTDDKEKPKGFASKIKIK